ncbi:MAG TPA: hypothetical protein VMB21_07355 [Candidatus Limnocylindria bacterium]|jgi:hypothetical protein|nr:hypothetical protein [Candidatus Limnocylindria bacterium]
MFSSIFWEAFIIVFGLGALGALLTWRPQNAYKSPMIVSLFPSLFLGIGSTPLLYHDHSSAWIPAVVLLPEIVLRPSTEVFLKGALPMAMSSFAWWCLLTAYCKHWRRRKGLA